MNIAMEILEVIPMKKFQGLSDSENEIMHVIWESNNPVTTAQLLTIFEDKKWKSQTISTFLKRMVDKGLLNQTTKGRTNFYTAVLTEQEYRHLEAKDLIDSMYNGSLCTFLATLYGEKSIKEEDLNELRQWFDEAMKND